MSVEHDQPTIHTNPNVNSSVQPGTEPVDPNRTPGDDFNHLDHEQVKDGTTPPAITNRVSSQDTQPIDMPAGISGATIGDAAPTAPTVANQPRFTKGQKVGAAVVAFVALGGAVLLGRTLTSNEDAPSTPVAAASSAPGPTAISTAETAEVIKRTGAVDLSGPLYSPAPGTPDTVTAQRGNGDIVTIHKMYGPESADPTQMGVSFLNVLAADLSLKPNAKVSAALSDVATFPQYMIPANQAFQRVNPTGEYNGQLLFSDSAENPVKFQLGPKDANGDQMLVTAPDSGPIYVAHVVDGAWQDPAELDKEAALKISYAELSYKPAADGQTATVTGFQFLDTNKDVVPLDALANLPPQE